MFDLFLSQIFCILLYHVETSVPTVETIPTVTSVWRLLFYYGAQTLSRLALGPSLAAQLLVLRENTFSVF
jgi:hypothetical protein